MSQSEMEPKSTGSESKLRVIDYDKEDSSFIVESPIGHILKISDTFAEMFPMWLGRVLITAESHKWALTSARAATGFATSIIMSPAEAGIEVAVKADTTPDGRPGVVIQIYHTSRRLLKGQMVARIGQCVLTCPTTAAFDALETARRKAKIGSSLRYFGDGFEKRDTIGGRAVWRIPVMEGEFIVEERFGVRRGVAGGNFLILSEDSKAGLQAAEKAVEAIRGISGVILPFPGGVCKSGTKIGSIKYKLPASTNHPFCPSLRGIVPESSLPPNVNCVYEIVVNGANLDLVKKAMGLGTEAATSVSGVVKITAANYGGRLGPYRAYLSEVMSLKQDNRS